MKNILQDFSKLECFNFLSQECPSAYIIWRIHFISWFQKCLWKFINLLNNEGFDKTALILSNLCLQMPEQSENHALPIFWLDK